MPLDFFTLYVIILLNSVMLAIVWGAIAVVHRRFVAARYWLASCLLTTTGGAAFALEGVAPGPSALIAGNALIVAGFCMTWTGIRVFHGLHPLVAVTTAVVVASMAAVALAGEARPAQNIAIAASQIVPFSLAIASLLAPGRRSLGALLAAAAVAIAWLGQAGELATNVLRLTGHLSDDAYYGAAAWFLVAAIFGGGATNIGFLLMAIDRLRAELAALAATDDLTGLANRRRLMEVAARQQAVGQRSGRGFAILLIDLDRFKDINDEFGHPVGDACLLHLTTIMARRLRHSDMPARLAGDEFCVLLPDTDARAAGIVAAGLVRAVAAEPCRWRGLEIRMSISAGVAGWHPASGMPFSATLEEADAALYEAKRRGRNGYRVGARPNTATLTRIAAAS